MAKRNKLAVFSVVALGMMFFAEQNKACTRAVYLGPDDMIVTGRTMDWKEDPQSNIYLSLGEWRNGEGLRTIR